MKNKDLTKLIKEESSLFVPNKKLELFNKLNIQNNNSLFLKNKNNVEVSLKEEGNKFVPDVKDNIYKSINKKDKFSFIKFIKNPTVYVPILSILVGVVLCSIIKPLSDINDSSTSPIENNQVFANTIDLKITSASKKYEPEIIYAVNDEGILDKDKVVSLNNESTNIINQMNNIDNDSNTFFVSYLTKALDIGYLERKNINEYNEITLSLLTSNIDLENNQFITSINEMINDFSYTNKVVINFITNIDDSFNNTEIDQNIYNLIKKIYTLTNRIFVKEDGTSSEFFVFSSNLNNWINKYKDTSEEELQEHLDFLVHLDETFSSQEKKALFLNDIDKLMPSINYIEKLSSYFDLFKTKYNEFIEYLNKKGIKIENIFDDINCTPWDWWKDYGRNKHDEFKPPHRLSNKIKFDDIESFLIELSKYIFSYDDTDNINYLKDKLREISDVLEEINYRYQSYVEDIDFEFNRILDKASDGYYFDEDERFEDNRHDKPSNWDEEFDYWFNNHKHH